MLKKLGLYLQLPLGCVFALLIHAAYATHAGAQADRPLHAAFEKELRKRMGTAGITSKRDAKNGRLDACRIAFSNLAEAQGRFFSLTAAFELFFSGKKGALLLTTMMQEFKEDYSPPPGLFPGGHGALAGMKTIRAPLEQAYVATGNDPAYGAVFSKTPERIGIAFRPEVVLERFLQAMQTGQLALIVLPSESENELRFNADFSVEDISAAGERRHSWRSLEQFKECTSDLLKQHVTDAQ